MLSFRLDGSDDDLNPHEGTPPALEPFTSGDAGTSGQAGEAEAGPLRSTPSYEGASASSVMERIVMLKQRIAKLHHEDAMADAALRRSSGASDSGSPTKGRVRRESVTMVPSVRTKKKYFEEVMKLEEELKQQERLSEELNRAQRQAVRRVSTPLAVPLAEEPEAGTTEASGRLAGDAAAEALLAEVEAGVGDGDAAFNDDDSGDDFVDSLVADMLAGRSLSESDECVDDGCGDGGQGLSTALGADSNGLAAVESHFAELDAPVTLESSEVRHGVFSVSLKIVSETKW